MATKKKPEVGEEEIIEEQEVEEKTAPALRVHVVKKGDTLRSIARDYLGDSSRVAEIRELNQLATDVLKVGRELTIPER